MQVVDRDTNELRKIFAPSPIFALAACVLLLMVSMFILYWDLLILRRHYFKKALAVFLLIFFHLSFIFVVMPFL
jgi:hypothetical protein